MILAIDIGNSNIVFGIYSENKWQHVWRIQTDAHKTADEYEVIFRSLLTNEEFSREQITKTVLSSVVPSLNREFKTMLTRLTGLPLIIISPEIYDKLPLKILNPFEIGTDLVANATAAYCRFEQLCMVVDFGTALTFTTIGDDGTILGVAIAPGLRTAVKALSGNTAQLPNVEIACPPSVLGTNTIHAIQSGIVVGYTGLVDRIIEKTIQAVGKDLKIVATGGLAGVFAPKCDKINFVDEELTLEGLRIIALLLAD